MFAFMTGSLEMGKSKILTRPCSDDIVDLENVWKEYERIADRSSLVIEY